MKPKIYDNYPLSIVSTIGLLFLVFYLAGAYIMFRLHVIAGALYILYILLMEYFVYKEACPHCFYYGKRCAFGRGVIAGIIHKKGDPKKFCEKEMRFKDFVPQIILLLVPIVVGIALLVSRGYHLLTLIALLYPVFNWFALNPIIYGKLACPHCKQGSMCCPALEFFGKKKK